MDLGKVWPDLKFSEAFVINDSKSCFLVISRLGGSNFFNSQSEDLKHCWDANDEHESLH